MDWDYTGARGPEHWKDICDIFKEAEEGSLQSPISLKQTEISSYIHAGLLQFDYHQTTFETSYYNHTLHLAPIAKEKVNHVVFNHKRYVLEDIHFHLPSEHLIDDQSFPLEFHLVHRSPKNELLVIGVMAEPTTIPLNEKMANLDKKALNPRISARGLLVPIDLMNLLPYNLDYFHYSGSLTTPPTSGPVNWIVFQFPVYMRQGLLKAFKEQIGQTNRPVQPRKNRPIYLSK
ncbi:carbonic anhydrase [Carnobacterium gallinarum]|uniref:carbonic anhydrase n=1 Tax=Carnobacterium gallinarum TaxID=2749 RepID=UPI000550698F|nr:carbonic anhydrase family protein [Carnobacterium gallinarum]